MNIRSFFIKPKLLYPLQLLVFSLPEDKLDLLIECINNRKDYDLYGVTNLEDAAIKYGRKPICPKCSCENYIENGHTPVYHKRFKCENVIPRFKFSSSSTTSIPGIACNSNNPDFCVNVILFSFPSYFAIIEDTFEMRKVIGMDICGEMDEAVNSEFGSIYNEINQAVNMRFLKFRIS